MLNVPVFAHTAVGGAQIDADNFAHIQTFPDLQMSFILLYFTLSRPERQEHCIQHCILVNLSKNIIIHETQFVKVTA